MTVKAIEDIRIHDEAAMVARSCRGRAASASIRSTSTAPMTGRTSVWPVNIATTHTASQDVTMTTTVISRSLSAVSR